MYSQPSFHDETLSARSAILTAEIDLRQIPKAQYDFDPVGPDIFRLSVNRTAMAPVHYEEASN
jgi:nitrilase